MGGGGGYKGKEADACRTGSTILQLVSISENMTETDDVASVTADGINRNIQKFTGRQGSYSLLKLPLSVVQRTHLSGFQPTGNTVKMKGVLWSQK